MKIDNSFFKPDIDFTGAAPNGPSSTPGRKEQSQPAWPLAVITAGFLVANVFLAPIPASVPAAVIHQARAGDRNPDRSERASGDRLQAILGRLVRQEKPEVDPALLAKAETVAEAVRTTTTDPQATIRTGVSFVRSSDD